MQTAQKAKAHEAGYENKISRVDQHGTAAKECDYAVLSQRRQQTPERRGEKKGENREAEGVILQALRKKPTHSATKTARYSTTRTRQASALLPPANWKAKPTRRCND